MWLTTQQSENYSAQFQLLYDSSLLYRAAAFTYEVKQSGSYFLYLEIIL